MSEWKECKIGDVCDTQTGPFGSQLHNEDYVEIGTPIVTVEHLGSKHFTTQNLPCVSDEDKQRLSKYTLNIGDVVFSRVGSVDRCSYVSAPYDGWLFSGRCLRVRPNDETVLNSEFLYYYISNERIKTYIRNIAVGATMPSINTKLLNEVPISLPPLSEQKKIATILSALDEKIETNRQINARLEELAQAIFKSWFIDFEPFGGQMPEDWQTKSAESFFKIDIGKTPPRKEQQWFSSSNGVTWVSISDMGKSGMFISSSSEMLTEDAVDKFNVVIVPQDTILLSFKLTIGRVAIANSTLTTNEAIARFRLNAAYEREYLYLFLKEYDYNSLGSTSSIATAVNSKIIKNMAITMPSLEALNQYSQRVSTIFAKIESLSKESARLAELRDTLLPKLMSGELIPE